MRYFLPSRNHWYLHNSNHGHINTHIAAIELLEVPVTASQKTESSDEAADHISPLETRFTVHSTDLISNILTINPSCQQEDQDDTPAPFSSRKGQRSYRRSSRNTNRPSRPHRSTNPPLQQNQP